MCRSLQLFDFLATKFDMVIKAKTDDVFFYFFDSNFVRVNQKKNITDNRISFKLIVIEPFSFGFESSNKQQV